MLNNGFAVFEKFIPINSELMAVFHNYCCTILLIRTKKNLEFIIGFDNYHVNIFN